MNGLPGPAESERQEALEAARKAVELDPAGAYGYGALSYALGRVGQYDEAIRAAEEAVRLSPDDALAHVALAEAYSIAEEPAKAIPAFEEALRLKQTLPHTPGRLAVAYMQVNRSQEGEEICRRILEDRPGDPQTLVYLTQALVAQNRIAEAEEVFAQISEKDKASLHTDFTEACLLEAKGDKLAAASGVRAALVDRPRNVVARFRMAKLLRELGRVEEAIDLLRKGLELLPDSFLIEFELGVALANSGQIREAQPIFEKWSELRPEDPTPPLNLSAVAFRAGRPADAIPHLRRAYALIEASSLVDYSELRSSIARRMEEARQQVELLEGIDDVLAGRETYDAHDLGWMLDIHWARGEWKKAGRLHDLIEASDADSTQRAQSCYVRAWRSLAYSIAEDLPNPLEAGDSETLRREALACLERLLTLPDSAPSDRELVESQLQSLRMWQPMVQLRESADSDTLPLDELKRWREVWAAMDAVPEAAEEGK